MAHACQVFNNAGTQRKHSTPFRSFLSFFYHYGLSSLLWEIVLRLLWFINHLNEHQKRKKKIERFLSFPKLASHEQQGDEVLPGKKV